MQNAEKRLQVLISIFFVHIESLNFRAKISDFRMKKKNLLPTSAFGLRKAWLSSALRKIRKTGLPTWTLSRSFLISFALAPRTSLLLMANKKSPGATKSLCKVVLTILFGMHVSKVKKGLHSLKKWARRTLIFNSTSFAQ